VVLLSGRSEQAPKGFAGLLWLFPASYSVNKCPAAPAERLYLHQYYGCWNCPCLSAASTVPPRARKGGSFNCKLWTGTVLDGGFSLAPVLKLWFDHLAFPVPLFPTTSAASDPAKSEHRYFGQ